MKRVSVTEFKSHCLGLLEEARKTGEPIELVKRGKWFATVVPAPQEGSYQPGQFKDIVRVVGDIEVDGEELGVVWDVLS